MGIYTYTDTGINALWEGLQIDIGWTYRGWVEQGGWGEGWNSVFITIKECLNISYLVLSIEKVKTYFTNREGRMRKDEEG